MAAVAISSIIIFYDKTSWEFLLRGMVVIVPIISLLMASTIPYDGYPKFNLREKGPNRVKLMILIVSIMFFNYFPITFSCNCNADLPCFRTFFVFAIKFTRCK